METVHGLLNALGILEIPSGQTEEGLVKRALQDNFFWNRVQVRLVELEAVATANNLPKLERDAFRDRLVPRIVKPAVVWGLIMPDQSTTGQMTIAARCGAGDQRWNGDWRHVRKLKLFGEFVPGDIVELYEIHYKTPVVDPMWIAEQREQAKYQQEAQQRLQNSRLSPDEIAANEQLRKSGFIK
jgi:hypothetical protein